MWTRNVLIVAAAGALSAAPLLAQQKSVAAPRTVASAVRDTLQSHRVRHGTTKAQPTKADTATKAITTASRSVAATSKAHAKRAAGHSAKHSTKHSTKYSKKHSTKSDTTGTRTPSSAKP